MWLEACRAKANEPEFVVLLVANKCDSGTREVSREEGETLAQENDLFYMETSGKTRENVEEAFLLVAENVLAKVEKKLIPESLVLRE